MKKNHSPLSLTAFAFFAIFTAGLGCNHHVYSPPARFYALQSPATLKEGRSAISFESGWNAMVFGPAFAGGSFRYRRGFPYGLELNLEGSLVGGLDVPANSSVTQFGLAGRVGLRYSPQLLGGHFSIQGGVGAGSWAAGGLVAGDFGFIVGFENPYAIPWASLSVSMSQPVGAREINTSGSGEDPYDPDHAGTPQTTLGLQCNVGIKVNFSPSGAIYLSFVLHYLNDFKEYISIPGGAGGIELYF